MAIRLIECLPAQSRLSSPNVETEFLNLIPDFNFLLPSCWWKQMTAIYNYSEATSPVRTLPNCLPTTQPSGIFIKYTYFKVFFKVVVKFSFYQKRNALKNRLSIFLGTFSAALVGTNEG